MLDLSLRNPAIFSYAFGTLAFVAFGIHLATGSRGGARAAVLLATIAASALWAALNLGFALTEGGAWWKAQAMLDALRSAGWLAFVIALLGGVRRGSQWGPALLLLPAAAWFLPPGAPVADAGVSRLAFGVLLGVSIAGLVLTEQVFRRALEQARWAIKPLCLGLGGGFVFDLYMYADALLLGRLDADIWAARGFAQALVIPFIALATARNKDWTIDIALSRGVLFHSTAFLASGMYLLAVSAAGYYVRYFGGSWGKTFQVGFIFAAVLLLGWLFSSGALRSRLKVFINKNFFSYRYDYREEWLRFTSLLATRENNISAPQRCIQALANLVESPGGALWLRGEQGSFAQAARWNLPESQAREHPAHPLASFMRSTGWVVNLDEYREDASRYPDLKLPAWLENLAQAWLVVPVIAQEDLIGFMVLAAPRAAIDVNWEVRDLLKTAARQIGSFLAQMQSSEALLEAKKFDAFNKMTAFVVHDLKNLVAQLALLLKNAERHRHNPRFQEDMLATVRHVAERMNKLLLQLSTGSRGAENLLPVDLALVAGRVLQAKAKDARPIAIEAAPEVLALAHEQRLERVIGHLLQNALDATELGGVVAIRVFADGSRACVEVSDTGCGMSEEFLRERLFRPFQTTKGAGMGIGAYEAAQYVKEIGGALEAQSKPGAGSKIRVILPLHRDPAWQDRQQREVA